MSDYHLVTVRVIAMTPTSELAPDDQDLPSEVPVQIDTDVPTDQIADAALDIFHEKMGVKRQEDFEFEVWQDGVELYPANDHDSYSLADRGDLS